MSLNHWLIKGTGTGLLLLGWLLPGCATNPVTGKQDFVLMTESEEVSLGARYHQQILQQYSRYQSPELEAYLVELGRELAAKSHRPGLKFEFTLLDSPEVNAFALPGGYVYITRGIMAYFNSEAEFAGVIGHEIGHVTARHSVRQQSQSTVTGILGAVLATQVGSGAEDLISNLGTALIRGYGREHELEADRLGAEYLARTGYDPEAMLEVIGVLKNQEIYAAREGGGSQAYHGVFSTHPDNDKRLKEVVRAARRYQGQQPSRPSNRDRYLDAIDGMVFGPSAEQGLARDGVFYHPPSRIAFPLPAGWTLQNTAKRLLLVSPEQDALVQVEIKPEAGKGNLEAELLGLTGLKRLEQSETLQAGDLKGISTSVQGKTAFGEGRVQLTLWQQDQNLWLFAASAKAGFDPKELPATVAGGFRRMDAAEQARIKPLRIKVITARRGDRYSDLAGQSPLGAAAEARLRLLNDQLDGGEPVAGRKLKILQ